MKKKANNLSQFLNLEAGSDEQISSPNSIPLKMFKS